MNSFFKKNIILISVGAIPAVLIRWKFKEIFFVNICGCLLLGYINRLNISNRYKLMFGFGFCGTLTTFSGLSFQLFKLLNEGLYKQFFYNSILVVFLGFFAVGLGDLIAKQMTN